MSVISLQQESGEGVIYTFNPIIGQPLDGLIKLGYRVKQSMLLHVATDDFLRGILILDARDKVHVYPKSATAVAATLGKSTYLFTADQTTGILSGFSLSYSTTQVCFKDTHIYPMCRCMLSNIDRFNGRNCRN